MLKYLGLVVMGICVALSITEVGLRLRSSPLWKDKVTFGSYEWLAYDPVVAWRNKAGYVGPAFRINRLHMRGADAAAHKPPGSLRIICLGDSRTFGIWLDLHRFRYDNDYPSVLAALVQHAPTSRPVEVLNAGVIGYTSAHGVRQLMTDILPLRPDIIVAAFGFNDHLLSWNPALRCLEPHNPLARQFFYHLDGLRLFQFGLSLYQGISSLHPAPLTIRWVEPDEYAYNLHRFAAIARSNGIRLLLLAQTLRPIERGDSAPAFPDAANPLRDPYVLLGAKNLGDLHRIDDEYRNVLYRVARDEHLPLADAAAAFGVHRGEPLFGAYDLVHVNLAGARLIAQTIDAKLVELGWLSDPPTGGPR